MEVISKLERYIVVHARKDHTDTSKLGRDRGIGQKQQKQMENHTSQYMVDYMEGKKCQVF